MKPDSCGAVMRKWLSVRRVSTWRSAQRCCCRNLPVSQVFTQRRGPDKARQNMSEPSPQPCCRKCLTFQNQTLTMASSMAMTSWLMRFLEKSTRISPSSVCRVVLSTVSDKITLFTTTNDTITRQQKTFRSLVNTPISCLIGILINPLMSYSVGVKKVLSETAADFSDVLIIEEAKKT